MVALSQANEWYTMLLGFLAVLLGAANAAGGYVVTERMLGMFATKKKPVESGKES
jgi:NAD(P) transhydrogenase subunit alpha